MDGFLYNPRRAPRVPLETAVDLACEGEVWRATTGDLGPDGCLVVTPRPLPRSAPLHVLLHGPGGADGLSVPGQVAWRARGRVGVAFAPRACDDPRAWFARLLDARPPLRTAAARVPDRLAPGTPLFFLPGSEGVPLAPDELHLLRAFSSASPAGLVAIRSGLAPDRLARALFALLEKRVLTASKGEALAACLRAGPAARSAAR